ncbi:cbb3-type cytochrome oxidase assembly protein CcoS [Microbaculum marinum]|uniref:Cbb3-type cytochrome oxidase assembly protein CcoS n=1 Tax=Microbaculum marinum TaxID=1764581 RepID=A0AAW9RJE2_9HYPH
MTVLAWLIPIALAMGAVALLAFIWSMRTGQYDDLDGAAERVLLAQKEDWPLTEPSDQSARKNDNERR